MCSVKFACAFLHRPGGEDRGPMHRQGGADLLDRTVHRACAVAHGVAHVAATHETIPSGPTAIIPSGRGTLRRVQDPCLDHILPSRDRIDEPRRARYMSISDVPY